MGTAVDGSDLDLVVTLPSVHRSTLTSKPGDLHGSTEDPHDVGMFGKLKKKLETMGATEVRVIRGRIGVVKCKWNTGYGEGVEGDISFETSSHHGVRCLTFVKEQVAKVRLDKERRTAGAKR